MGRGRAPVTGSALLHRPPRARIVEPRAFLEPIVRGRRAIHVGFADAGLTAERRAAGTWLHDALAREASELVGIDTDAAGVELARSLGYEAHVADCQSHAELAALGLAPADVVVAGELIEHLDRPGDFLDAVRQLLRQDGALVLTTPNALRLTNALATLLRREVVSTDHVAWYTWRTLATLLGRHGLSVTELAYYPIQRLPAGGTLGRRDRLLTHAYNTVARPAARAASMLWPQLSDGLIVVAGLPRPRDSSSGRG